MSFIIKPKDIEPSPVFHTMGIERGIVYYTFEYKKPVSEPILVPEESLAYSPALNYSYSYSNSADIGTKLLGAAIILLGGLYAMYTGDTSMIERGVYMFQ